MQKQISLTSGPFVITFLYSASLPVVSEMNCASNSLTPIEIHLKRTYDMLHWGDHKLKHLIRGLNY